MAGYELVYFGIPGVLVAGVILLFWNLISDTITGPCAECGMKNDKRRAFCKNCGLNIAKQPGFSESDIFSRNTVILSFLIPFLGLYMYYAYIDLYPHRGRNLWLAGVVGLLVIPFNVLGGFVFYYSYW